MPMLLGSGIFSPRFVGISLSDSPAGAMFEGLEAHRQARRKRSQSQLN